MCPNECRLAGAHLSGCFEGSPKPRAASRLADFMEVQSQGAAPDPQCARPAENSNHHDATGTPDNPSGAYFP